MAQDGKIHMVPAIAGSAGVEPMICRKHVFRLAALTAACLAASMAMSCATTGTAAPAAVRPAIQPGPDEYAGSGRGDNLQKALNAARRDALGKAVVDAIGQEAEAKNRAALERSVYALAALDRLLKPDTLKKLSSTNAGTVDRPDWVVEISVAVDRPALEAALAAMAGPPVDSGKAQPAPVATKSAAEPAPAGPTAAQKAFIGKYVDKLSYLVHYDEKAAGNDQVPLRSAVAMANSWLAGQGFDVASGAQVEKLKKDRQMVYEEQSGEQASVIQWVSQSLNADIYLEIEARLVRDARGANYYSQATVSIQMYESSTGQLLGGTPAVPGPQRMSSIDQTEADSKSLQDTVYALMPRVVEQSKALLGKQYANGIKYQVVIQKAGDPDVIADFRSALKRQANIADVLTRSESEGEVVMDVYMFGRVDDLGDTIRAVRSMVVGLDKMRQVQKRGKTLTFDSGM
jgi:hypothetical protein